MSKNEELHKMCAQILNLRSAGITLATAIHHFPPCGRPGSCKGECPEAKAALQQVYESMHDLMLSVRMALAAVFQPDPEVWDFLWELNKESKCVERDMAILGRDSCQNQHEFIRCWGEMDDEMMDQLGTGFTEEEWKALTAKRAWQNGRRLPHVLHLLKYLEDQISKQCDLYESVIYSGLLGDCNLSRWAEMKKEAALH